MATSPDLNPMNPAFPVEVAVRHICGQHRNLARVLKVQESLVGAIATGKTLPDFGLIAAMLCYIDTFSKRIHHPAEEKFLFSAMRQCGAPSQVVDSAIVAHGTGANKFATVQYAFNAWRETPGVRDPSFRQLVPDYTAFELGLMAYEESVVLPCAMDTLSANDWTAIAEAFSSRDDPLFGVNPAPELAQLRHLLTAQPVALSSVCSAAALQQ